MAASIIIRSGSTPLRNSIQRHLFPTVATMARASATTQHVYDWNNQFPYTFGHPPDSLFQNQAVSRLPCGNQIGGWAFSAVNYQSSIQVCGIPKKIDSDSDDQEYDSDDQDYASDEIDSLHSDEDLDYSDNDEDFDEENQ